MNLNKVHFLNGLAGALRVIGKLERARRFERDQYIDEAINEHLRTAIVAAGHLGWPDMQRRVIRASTILRQARQAPDTSPSDKYARILKVVAKVLVQLSKEATRREASKHLRYR